MTKYSPDRDVAGKLTGKKNVRRVMEKLAELSLRRVPSDRVPPAKDDRFKGFEELIDWLLDERRIRGQHFPPELVSGPGWDIMLDLLRAKVERRPLPVSSLCVASWLPATSAARWVDALEDWGLVARRQDQEVPAGDALELTSRACAAFDSYLDELSGPSAECDGP